MKIVVKEQGKMRISLWFPTSVLKWKFVGKAIFKKAFENSGSKPSTEDFQKLPNLQKELYQKILQIKKQQKYFTILEVESKDGQYVLIKL